MVLEGTFMSYFQQLVHNYITTMNIVGLTIHIHVEASTHLWKQYSPWARHHQHNC